MDPQIIVTSTKVDPVKGEYTVYVCLYENPLGGSAEEDRWKAGPGYPADIARSTHGSIPFEQFKEQPGVTESMVELIEQAIPKATRYYKSAVKKSNNGLPDYWPIRSIYPDGVSR
jgi:hypothetical protein